MKTFRVEVSNNPVAEKIIHIQAENAIDAERKAKLMIQLTANPIARIVSTVEGSKDMEHKHSGLITKWLKDTEQVIEQLIYGDWHRSSIGALIDTDNQDEQFRIKPREFSVGEWYPCVVKRSGVESVLVYIGDGEFSLHNGGIVSKLEQDLVIGKSLGKLKFGGDDA